MNKHCIVTYSDEHHVLVDVNDKLLQITGYDRDDLIGKDAKILHPPNAAPIATAIRQAMEKGESWDGETRLRCKDGSLRWTQTTVYPYLGPDGQFLGAISVRTDVTDVKIATTDREMTSVVHRIADLVFVIDAATHRFIYMNEAAASQLGWTGQEYASRSLADVNERITLERFNEIVQPLVDGNATRIDLETDIFSEPHSVTVQLVTPEAGSARYVAIFHNISARMEAERVKSELVATVSHELRSPLTSVKGAMGLLLAGACGELPDKVREMVEIAQRNADNLVLIVNDILDIEKFAAGRMEFNIQNSDICAVIREAVEANSAGAARFDVEYVIEGCDEAVMVDFDSGRIQQVFGNLFSNAMKFSNAGGRIVVSLNPVENGYDIAVRDYGVGISEEELGGLFERFSQARNRTKRSGEGTGLGLSIVKAIVEAHGWTVRAESTLNEGTCITICLPRPDGGAMASADESDGKRRNHT
nr:PAS domain-containing sensor histidine kinase [Pseudoruegeria sp. HB172150]